MFGRERWTTIISGKHKRNLGGDKIVLYLDFNDSYTK